MAILLLANALRINRYIAAGLNLINASIYIRMPEHHCATGLSGCKHLCCPLRTSTFCLVQYLLTMLMIQIGPRDCQPHFQMHIGNAAMYFEKKEAWERHFRLLVVSVHLGR